VAEGGDDFFHVVGHAHTDITHACGAGFLAHDGHFGFDFEWVVRADLATEAIFQRGDDAAAVGVVIGVGRGNEDDIEWQADLVTTNLHIAGSSSTLSKPT